MNKAKDCSYQAYLHRECGYDEYLEQAYHAKGQLTKHYSDKVKRKHPFFIIVKEDVDYEGNAFLMFSIYDETRGLLQKIKERITEPRITAAEVWQRAIETLPELREYFQYLNDTRS